MRIGIYVDFDNLYNGFLDKLGIKRREEKNLSKLRINILAELIESIFAFNSETFEKELNFCENLHPIRHYIQPLLYNFKINHSDIDVAYTKVFAEYEKLPYAQDFFNYYRKGKERISIQVFMHSLNTKPINPFVNYSESGRVKNASDISLTLEVVTDLVKKNVPVDAVVIVSGDIDFYPLISWIKEHTEKEVYLLSIKGRLSQVYKKMHFINTLELDIQYNIDYAILKALLKTKQEEEIGEDDINWLMRIRERVVSDCLKVAIYEINREFKKNLVKEQIEGKCKKFTQKVLEGLSSWLNKKEEVKTGLIIKSWLPRWQLNITEEEANSCLKELLSSGIIEELGYRFIPEDSQTEGMVKGKIVRA